MNNFWPYIIKMIVVFTVLYAIYWIFYRTKTFHHTNRIILLIILLSSLLIPSMEFSFSPNLVPNKPYNFEWENVNQFIDDFAQPVVQKELHHYSIFDIMSWLYITGLLFFGTRFILYLIRILGLRYKSTSLKSNRITLVYTRNQLPPFTFFKWVFLPEDEFKEIYSHPIIEHERAHARQWHSFDLLLAELFSIFLWFVPFVYSFKNSIKSVHEYLADSCTVNSVSNKIDYLQLLAQNTEKYTLIGLSIHFYCKTLKNRITMITKNKSSNWSKIQYSILIPTFIILVFACSQVDKPELLNTSNVTSVEKHESIASPAFIQPIKASECKSVSGFGMRVHPLTKKRIMHNAIDFGAKEGTEIMATADGVVIKINKPKDTKGQGNAIVIQHANGFISVYTHLSAFKTELGKNVKQGEIIGLVGNTGLSTGPHLHFELQKDGKFVNPADYFN